MTDISALESYAGQLSEAAQLSRGAAEKQHQYIHGDATTDVVTESGPVPTIAKQARLSMEQTAGLRSELASADDDAKGAGMVALPHGNVRQAINYLTPEMFGAKGDGIADDTLAVTLANTVAGVGGKALYFSDGKTYNVTNISDVTNNNVHWLGRGKIHITSNTGAITFSSVPTEAALGANVAKGDHAVTLADASIVKPGSIIYIRNAIAPCSIYPIGPCQAMTVAGNMTSVLTPAVTGNTVGTLEASEWSFKTTDAGIAVTIYAAPRHVIIDGVQFYRDSVITNRAVTLQGCTFDVSDINVYNAVAPDPDNGQDGIQISRCVNSKITNFRGDNLRYAIQVIDGSSNIEVFDPYFKRCRHGIYPNSWAVGLKVFNVRGENNNAILDSHASLNMYVDGVFTSSDRGFSNVRGDGTTLRNVNITTTAETTGDGFRAAQIQWNDTCAEQRNSRDTILENVKITYPPTWNDHFNVGYAKNVILKNVNTYPASIAVLSGAVGDVAEVRMEDCNLNLALGSGSTVRAPIYSRGKNNRGSKIQAVTSDGVVYSLYPYPDGVVNGIDLEFSGSVFRDSVSVATRSFSLVLYPHTRPLNYFNLRSIEGLLRLRITGNNFTITDYTLPFKFAFSGSVLGGSIGTLVGTSLVADIIPMEVGSVVSVITSGLWELKIPFSIIRKNTGQLFSVSYSVEAIGSLY